MPANTTKIRFLITFFSVLLTFQNAFSQTGTHLNFDGINDAVFISSSVFPLGNQARTVEAWVKTSQSVTTGSIFSFGNMAGFDQRFSLNQSNGKLMFTSDGSYYNSDVTISDNVWHHIAATFNGINLKLYVDGVQAGTTQTFTLNTTGTACSIGGLGINGEFFNGDIDEVRVWNVARTAGEIVQTMNCEIPSSESGLLAYYKFNQGVGGQSNASVTSLTNATSLTGLTGTLSGFALSGASSNWLAGSVMSIAPNPPDLTPFYGAGQTYCESPLTVSILRPSPLSNRRWFRTAVGGTPLNISDTITGGFYYVDSVNANGCASATRSTILIVQLEQPSIISDSICLSDSAYIKVSPNTKWIDWKLNGTIVATDTVKLGNLVTVKAGGNGLGAASNQLNRPRGVFADSNGDIYVADTDNQRIQKWSSGATTGITVAGGNGPGASSNQLNQPTDVNLDAAGNIYICDRLNDRIQKWIPGATSGITVAGGNGAGTGANQLNSPWSFCLDSTDNIYVIGGSGVQKWAPGATTGITLIPGITGRGICIDRLGNIYVSQLVGSTGQVLKFAPGATTGIMVAGGTAVGNAPQLGEPYQIAVDREDNLYVADPYLNRVMKFVPGVYLGSPVAIGVFGASTTGYPALTPFDVCVDSSGNVYTAEFNGHRIQKWPGSVVSRYLPTETGSLQAFLRMDGVNSCTVESGAILINEAFIANANATLTQNVTGTTWLTNSCADLIAKIVPNGPSPLTGNTTGRVWIEATQPSQFVKRHYDINQAIAVTTATGRATLYFTQDEFDAYNAVNGTGNLPTNSADAPGKANLKIEQRLGTSSDGSGLPQSYTGATVIIDPDDADIIWNSNAGRWEVTFDVTGFSGFFVKTNSAILPLKLQSFTANRQSINAVLLQWQAADEIQFSHYEIEKSVDGRSFNSIGNIAVNGNGAIVKNYQLVDEKANNSIQYYRIKMVNLNGSFSYSNILRISQQNSGLITIFPNPVSNIGTLQGMDNSLINTNAQIIDAQGRAVLNIVIKGQSQQINLSGIAAGIYVVRFNDGTVCKFIKQ